MCQPVVSGGDPSEVLDPAEHTLDGVAVAVEGGREAGLPAPIGFRRDVGRRAPGFDLPAHGVAVIAFVSMQDRRRRHLVEQGVGGGAIGNLATGEQERDGAAEGVGQGVDLRRPAAPRAAYRLIALPPFPPDAQRWAFTAEESINTSAGGPPAEASAWKISVHTPLAAQRTNRLYSVLCGP